MMLAVKSQIICSTCSWQLGNKMLGLFFKTSFELVTDLWHLLTNFLVTFLQDSYRLLT